MPRVLLCSGPGLSAGCRGNEKNIRSAVPEASIRGVHTPRESRPAGHDGHDGAVLGAVLPSPVVRPRTPGDLPALVRSLGEQQPTSSYPMRWPLPFPVEQFIVREGQERSWVVVLGGRVVGHVGVGRPRGDVERAFLDALGGRFVVVLEGGGYALPHLVRFAGQRALGDQFLALALQFGIHLLQRLAALLAALLQGLRQLRIVGGFGRLAIAFDGIESGVGEALENGASHCFISLFAVFAMQGKSTATRLGPGYTASCPCAAPLR